MLINSVVKSVKLQFNTAIKYERFLAFLNNSMNYIHEFTLKLIHDEHVQSLQNIPEVTDENTIHQQD